MSDVRHTRIRMAMARLREVWADLDYAQRRTLEIRTGLRFVDRARPKVARSVDDLEALYANSGLPLSGDPELADGGSGRR